MKQEYLFLQSLISDTFVKDLSVYNGKEVTFVITEYDPKNRKIIGDCKQLIVAAKKAAAEAKFFLRLRKAIQSKEQLRMLQISVHSLT